MRNATYRSQCTKPYTGNDITSFHVLLSASTSCHHVQSCFSPYSPSKAARLGKLKDLLGYKIKGLATGTSTIIPMVEFPAQGLTVSIRFFLFILICMPLFKVQLGFLNVMFFVNFTNKFERILRMLASYVNAMALYPSPGFHH